MSSVSQGIASRPVVRRHPLLAKLHRVIVGSTAIAIGLLAGLSSLPASSAVVIPQTPLSLGVPVPGNLALTPSVEFPTIHSQANLGNYDVARKYVGYFDPGLCYEYNFSNTEADRHFYPVATTANGRCTGNRQWSGNFLSWAATQTIDPFRLALTGGYRVRDTPTETWLEKARHAPGYGLFPNRQLTNAGLIDDSTPSGFSTFNLRIAGLNNRMYFTQTGDMANPGATLVAYNPQNDRLRDRNGERELVYEVSVRVKVCDASVRTEAFCKQYSQGWKPEGLVQEYNRQLTYSIFGYLNDSGANRDGGVMRARQKFVGPSTYYPGNAAVANSAAEWDGTTGVLVRNPDLADANATGNGVVDSGVINYLNKFGQMTTQNPKSFDPVSELYYAATRYFKNQGNVPEYTNMTGTAAQRYALADGFPVITNWDDPIRYSCQTNVILGIGDVYTWNDKNLPGSAFNGTEPARPALVTADTTVNVATRAQQIFDMEGFGALTNPFSGRNNSAFIAALAYDVHTRDIRPTTVGQPQTDGLQTIATHWVDVRENQTLEGRRNNPYWLAAKYGGFDVPIGFDPDTNGATPLPQASWHTTNEFLTAGTTYPRADNFYVASEADKMVASLRRAFQSIVQAATASGSSLSANSTVLRSGTKIFQAQYNTGRWSGDLVAYNVDPVTGALTEGWRASNNVPAWATRKIYVNSGQYRLFTYNNLNGTDAAALGSQQIVDYLRGDRSNETPNGLALRARSSVLGDIVHSQPIFVGAPNASLYNGRLFSGASSYAAFAAAQASRRSVVYVGANDGMLHGFDATTGAETYAFVPSSAIANLQEYSDADYIHRYYVDGEITIADVYFGNQWRSILVGTMGRGGRGVFALDVTDPDDVEFLWEKTGTTVPALGNVLSKPIIAQVADGDWRVFIGNGPNGSGDRAQMIMFDIDDGGTTVADTGVGSDNGMFGVNAWASGLTDFVDTAYAGDLNGNLWKITNLAGTPTTTRFFTANSGGVTRPITITPTVAVNPSTGDTWVMFGTGSYFTVADQTNRDLQQWFGLIDRGSTINDRSGLEQVNILQQGTSSGELVRTIETNSSPGTDGWFIDLIAPSASNTGERMVVPNIFRGGALIGVTRIPDSNTDPCNASGATGFIMAINPFTGGRLDTPPFDINGDGNFDANDGINGTPAFGFGLDAGTYSPLLISNRFYLNDQNANITQGRFSFGSQPPIRVSWREIIRN
jgi:type IV pilus assembly protein PilY1